MSDVPLHEVNITVRLTDDMQARLARNAANAGKSLPDYLALLVQQIVLKPRGSSPADDQLQQNFNSSGLSDDELSEVLEEAKHEMRAERRARRPA